MSEKRDEADVTASAHVGSKAAVQSDLGQDGAAAADAQLLSDDQAKRRFGFIAVIGAPNAGKSSLVNRLVGGKVSIVTHKVQTTRVPVRGIMASGNSQLVFIDTPGIFQPRQTLDQAMVEAAWGGAGEADIVALIVDAVRGLSDEVRAILDAWPNDKRPSVLLLNKVDRVSDKGKLLELIAQITQERAFDEVFPISALTGEGLKAFQNHLAANVPVGPWHYPEDEMSDLPVRLLAAEITREQIYKRLHDELPYAVTVETTDWKTLRNKSVRVEQTIYVERDSQKAIVLGKGGQSVKQISAEARREIGSIVEQPVHLFLFVKVRPAWKSDPERYREMGLAFPKAKPSV